MINPRKDYIYITVQPNSPRFMWEGFVQFNRLIELGVDPKNIYAIYQDEGQGRDFNKWPHLSKINVWLAPTPKFEYKPAMRAYLLSKLADSLPDKSVVYIDSDVYPISLPDIKSENGVCVSYNGHLAVRRMASKESGVFGLMCDAAGISPDDAISKAMDTGGAQYIFPPEVFINDFWSEAGSLMVEINKILENESKSDKTIRPWVADMWAIMLLLWKKKVLTVRATQMSVCHAPDTAEEWDESNWYHNSFLTSANKRTKISGKDNLLFDKNEYRDKLPFGEDVSYVKRGTCSRIYADIVSKTKIDV